MNENYKQETRRRIKGRVEMMYGSKGIRWLVFISWFFVNTVSYFLIQKYWGAETALHDVVVSSITSAIVTAITFGSILFIWRFFEIPKEVYNEQNKEINNFRNKWGLEKIATTNIRLVPKGRQDGMTTARLDVKNDESSDLLNAYMVITKVLIGKNGYWVEGQTQELLGSKFKFYYSQDTQADIKRGTLDFAYIANVFSDGKIVLLFESSNHPIMGLSYFAINESDSSTDVYVEIMLFGEMKGFGEEFSIPIEPIPFHGFLICENNCVYLKEGDLIYKQ